MSQGASGSLQVAWADWGGRAGRGRGEGGPHTHFSCRRCICIPRTCRSHRRRCRTHLERERPQERFQCLPLGREEVGCPISAPFGICLPFTRFKTGTKGPFPPMSLTQATGHGILCDRGGHGGEGSPVGQEQASGSMASGAGAGEGAVASPDDRKLRGRRCPGFYSPGRGRAGSARGARRRPLSICAPGRARTAAAAPPRRAPRPRSACSRLPAACVHRGATPHPGDGGF